MTRISYKVSILFIISAFIGTLGFRLSLPAVAFYSHEVLEFSFFGIGLLTSVFFLARTIMGLVSGVLTDKLSKKILLLSSFSFMLHGLIIQLYPLSNNLLTVLSIRLLQGLCNGIGWIPVQIYMGKMVSYNKRGRIYSIYFIMGSIGGLAGNGVYSIISKHDITQVLMVSTTSMIIVGILILLAHNLIKTMDDKPLSHAEIVNNRRKTRNKLVYIFRQSLFLIILIFSSGILSSFVNGDLVYVYLKEALQISKSMASLIIMISGLLALPISFIVSWISDKRSSMTALKVSVYFVLIGGLLIMLSTDFLVITGIGFLISGLSSIVPIVRKIAVSREEGYGTAMGLINAFSNIGTVSGALIAGFTINELGVKFINIYGFSISKPLSISFIPILIALLYLLNKLNKTTTME